MHAFTFCQSLDWCYFSWCRCCRVIQCVFDPLSLVINGFTGDSAAALKHGVKSTLHRVLNTGTEKFSTVFKLKGRPEQVGARNAADYYIADNHLRLVSSTRISPCLLSSFTKNRQIGLVEWIPLPLPSPITTLPSCNNYSNKHCNHYSYNKKRQQIPQFHQWRGWRWWFKISTFCWEYSAF